MLVVWLNGTVGSGKSTVGTALAGLLPASMFLDGDDLAGPSHLPNPVRWGMALDALLAAVIRPGRFRCLIVAYPLDSSGFLQLRAACGKARRRFIVINLDVPTSMTLRGRGGRAISTAEGKRIRAMRSEGYHRRPFAAATLHNTYPSVARASRRVLSLVRVTLAAK
jgi:energy-coupling factor transporter ATP-binding protein EcfA2